MVKKNSDRLTPTSRIARERGKISALTGKVGFSDLKYFLERFKEPFGATPSDYRPKAHPEQPFLP